MHADLVRRLERCQTLPTLPAVAVEIVDLCQRDDIDLQRIATALERDPALAAKVLKAANSSLIHSRSPVTTLKRAVALLGSNIVLTLALSFSLVGSRRRGQVGSYDHNLFWRRALLSAVAAQTLARMEGHNTEEAFLAALLQDIGILALLEVVPEYAALATEYAGSHHALAIAEREQFGVDHAEVGAYLADLWRLPSMFIDAITTSHQPAAAGAPPVLSCVALSGWLADVFCAKDAGAAAVLARDVAQQQYGRTPAAVDEGLQRMGELIPEVARNFDLRLNTVEEVSEILDQAREAMVHVSLRSAHQAIRAEQQVCELAEEKRTLEQRSLRDALTGLHNRHHLDDELRAAFVQARKVGEPLSLIFCDVDHFKRINDTQGHPFGDDVLRQIARVLDRSVLRQKRGDVVGRFGGEEFLIVLPNTDRTGALVVAERVRRQVEVLQLTGRDGQAVNVTVSLGVATDGQRRFDSAEHLLATADEALYQAKHDGRNRVAVAEPPLERVRLRMP